MSLKLLDTIIARLEGQLSPSRGTVGHGQSASLKAPSSQPPSKAAAPVARNKGGKVAADAAALRPPICRIDLRVGHIIECIPHPDAEALYVEKIDLGEPSGPRTICSGLRAFMQPEDLLNKKVLIAANLEPRSLRGIPSAGMVLCAKSEDGKVVELVEAGASAPIGARVTPRTGNPDHDFDVSPDAILKSKTKVWEAVAPGLRTADDLAATWDGFPLFTGCGANCTVKSLRGAAIS